MKVWEDIWNNLLWNRFLINGPTILFVFILLFSVFAKQYSLFYVIPFFILVNLLNIFLKASFKTQFGRVDEKGRLTGPSWGLRPSTCGKVGDKCVGCGFHASISTTHEEGEKEKNKEKKWGFPSGHAQASVALATFFTLYLLKNSNKNKDVILFPIFPMWLVVICVLYQRHHSECHNLAQLLSGSLVGFFLGFFFFFFICFSRNYHFIKH